MKKNKWNLTQVLTVWLLFEIMLLPLYNCLPIMNDNPIVKTKTMVQAVTPENLIDKLPESALYNILESLGSLFKPSKVRPPKNNAGKDTFG